MAAESIRRDTRRHDMRPGVGVDSRGGPVIDPTANVIALVEANAKAAAMLREADTKFNDAQAAHLKEVSALRAVNAETLRISDLDRLGKTREVDVNAAVASAAALATAVQTLATTSDRNAETLRSLVTATAQTMAKQTADQAAVLSAQTDSLVKDINARIAELQKSSYQGTGRSEGLSDSAKLLIGVLTVITLFLGLYTFTQRPSAGPVPTSGSSAPPQIIVVPIPAPPVASSPVVPK